MQISLHPTPTKEFHLDIQILVFLIMDTVPVMLDSKSSFAEILQQRTDASLLCSIGAFYYLCTNTIVSDYKCIIIYPTFGTIS